MNSYNTLKFVFICLWGSCWSFLSDGVSHSLTDPQHSQYTDILALIMEEKTLRHQLEWDLGEMKSKQKAMELQYKNNTDTLLKTIQELRTEKTNLQQQTDHMQQTINSMQQTLKSLQQHASPSTQHTTGSIASSSNVAFSGSLSDVNVTIWDSLKYSDIITNIGGSYNVTDGKFYCKTDGLYVVFVSVHYPSCSGGVVSIMVGSNSKHSLVANPVQRVSTEVVLHLNKDDTIWIQNNCGSGTLLKNSYFTVFAVPQ